MAKRISHSALGPSVSCEIGATSWSLRMAPDSSRMSTRPGVICPDRQKYRPGWMYRGLGGDALETGASRTLNIC